MSFNTAWPPSKTRDIEITYLLYTDTKLRMPRINELQILAGEITRSLTDTGRVLTAQAGSPLDGVRRQRKSFAIAAPVNVRPGRIHIKGLFLSTMNQYEVHNTVPVIYSNMIANVPGSNVNSVPTQEVRDDFQALYTILMANIPAYNIGEIVLSNVKFMSVNFGIGAYSFPS